MPSESLSRRSMWMHLTSPAASAGRRYISSTTLWATFPWMSAKSGTGMTEIMPVPRNLSFTVLPAGGLRSFFASHFSVIRPAISSATALDAACVASQETAVMQARPSRIRAISLHPSCRWAMVPNRQRKITSSPRSSTSKSLSQRNRPAGPHPGENPPRA